VNVARREKLLKLYQDLRVADVRDAMDALMLHRQGSMHHSIRPLWRTRAHGIAATARYLPYRGPRPPEGVKAYAEWSGRYYAEICRYPWVEELTPGDFMVIDCSGVDAGLMGSENTLSCLRRGCRGFVSDAGVRDTDEIVLQQVPFWTARICQSMVQARLVPSTSATRKSGVATMRPSGERRTARCRSSHARHRAANRPAPGALARTR
jgi:regulator of RNase E activity RraA